MRGEGNHKIPGSFAPENMEKTGADRVKYSLACQHEDAISIKFVSYAQKCPTVLCTFAVALRKESVDRNCRNRFCPTCQWVALRKESVDRNIPAMPKRPKHQTVALRKESVDRNPVGVGSLTTLGGSLSARRAWIEIDGRRYQGGGDSVALRKESVDRNQGVHYDNYNLHWSLSARRAWIEILASRLIDMSAAVALRKESVDRNIARGQLPTPQPPCRSPQGERG